MKYIFGILFPITVPGNRAKSFSGVCFKQTKYEKKTPVFSSNDVFFFQIQFPS